MSHPKLLLLFSFILSISCLSESDIPNFDKYYKPSEFYYDMFSADSKYSWHRYKQSEHFFVFWEAGFGSDPSTAQSTLQVDVDDLLNKVEQFYITNTQKIKMVTVGENKSYLDKYKLQIYLLYSTDWVATGSGYDNVIGALWVTPSTCHPVGSTIAHEIGHSFQYQVYADQIYRKEINGYEFQSGFRYGYENSNGGNGLWEQTANWQARIDYPDQIFNCYDFNPVWLNNHHKHFEHEWMRYASYWLHFYWASKHGLSVIGEIWRNSKYPEDAIQAYMRLYNDNSYEKQREELFDYAMKTATFDYDLVREYGKNFQGMYKTTFYKDSENYYQIAYEKCPGPTGFNVISLQVPNAETEITVEFVGLKPGANLASGDPGNYKENDAVAGTVTHYNTVNKENLGWRYGFVAHLKDDSRVYSKTFSDSKGKESFIVPGNTKALYMVVQGSPETYMQSAWDEKELTDAQFPYKVKFTGTDLL